MQRSKLSIASFWILCLAISMAACTPDSQVGELGPVPTEDQVKFTITPNADNPNVVSFRNETPGTITAVWDLATGSATGNTATGSYAIAGEYEVKLTVFTDGGHVSRTQTITIAQTNPAMLDIPEYNFLTGGGGNANGKTWVIDRETLGHMGVGPVDGESPIWWSAPPNDKASEGLYDDEMTFNLNNNFEYIYQNNGNTFVNGGNAPGLGGTAGDDHTLPYTPPTGLKWSIVDEGDKKFLQISNNGFIAYYTGTSRYEILALGENELYLKTHDAANSANGWWLRLVPKGYQAPVQEKPYRSANIFDDFNGNSNFTWTIENVDFQASYDNPKPLATPPKVAYYVKPEGEWAQWANMQTTLDFRIDLTQRNVFSLKAYFPGYNDYTQVARQVALKLHNSLEGGNSWQSQLEVIKTVSVNDQWVELEFDFSAFADLTQYDKIVLQFGGEGHPFSGVFFVSDFKLK